jgi:hypothetical protein
MQSGWVRDAESFLSSDTYAAVKLLKAHWLLFTLHKLTVTDAVSGVLRFSEFGALDEVQ